MKSDLRQATDAVLGLTASGEKAWYIDHCDLTTLDAEILKRKWVQKQSVVQISMEMHLSRECVQEHYRKSMLILHDIIRRMRK